MKIARRLRWIIPRFSLSNLLMLMVVIGLSLAWYDQRRKLGEQAEAIEKQRRTVARLSVANILRSEMTNDQKVKALEPFVKLGNSVRKIRELWDNETEEYGIFADGSWQMTPADCGLSLLCGPDGKIWWIGYHASGGSVELARIDRPPQQSQDNEGAP